MLTCKQKPVIGKTNLDSAAVTCGVLQEGNLGPLLFVSYVHDMAISFDQECKNIYSTKKVKENVFDGL